MPVRVWNDRFQSVSNKFMNFTKSKKGFGLLETLIACAVLILICGALLAINVIITRDIAYARDDSIASDLAQEGIESLRQIRDSNLIDGLDFTNWNSFVCDSSATPAVNTPVLSTASSTVYYTIVAGSYPACYGIASNPRMAIKNNPNGENIIIGSIIYNRKIRFLSSGVDPLVGGTPEVTEDNAIRAVVNISWNYRGSNRQVEISELLTNWKRGL